MRVVVLQLCVDPRLQHEEVRAQVADLLGSRHNPAERIFLVGEIGGNLSESYLHTVDLALQAGGTLVAAGALHHDDCLADGRGLRAPLSETVERLRDELTARGVACPVLAGHIDTATQRVSWSEEP